MPFKSTQTPPLSHKHYRTSIHGSMKQKHVNDCVDRPFRTHLWRDSSEESPSLLSSLPWGDGVIGPSSSRLGRTFRRSLSGGGPSEERWMSKNARDKGASEGRRNISPTLSRRCLSRWSSHTGLLTRNLHSLGNCDPGDQHCCLFTWIYLPCPAGSLEDAARTERPYSNPVLPLILNMIYRHAGDAVSPWPGQHRSRGKINNASSR